MSSKPVRPLEVVAAHAPPQTNAPEPPRWVAEAWHHSLEQLALFFQTSLQIGLHPRRFCREWADGEHRALNPLAYFASAVGLSSPILLLVKHLLGTSGEYSSAGVVVHHFEPYVQWLVLGLLC